MHTSERCVQPGLLDAVAAVSRLAEDLSCGFVIIGGVAVSLLSSPRYTQDADAVFMVDTADVMSFIDAAAKYDLIPQPEDPAAFVERTRVLPLRHLPTGTDVDISFGVLPFEVEMVERASTAELGGISLSLPTPEDLIIMKAVAHRPKDMLDIAGIASANPDLDTARIERWVREFAEALDEPQIWEDLASLLKIHR